MVKKDFPSIPGSLPAFQGNGTKVSRLGPLDIMLQVKKSTLGLIMSMNLLCCRLSNSPQLSRSRMKENSTQEMGI